MPSILSVTELSPTSLLESQKNESINSQLMNSIIESSIENINEENESDIDDDIEVKCNCQEHLGKELVNLKLKFPVDYLYECLIIGNEFTEKFHKKRKIWGKSLYFTIFLN
jgi:hypothetical protein